MQKRGNLKGEPSFILFRNKISELQLTPLLKEIGRIKRDTSPTRELTPNPLGISGTVHVNKLNFTLCSSHLQYPRKQIQ